ncbi:MAG: SdrD B-like domain-containing protein, partial [Chloroflexota bacterium]
CTFTNTGAMTLGSHLFYDDNNNGVWDLATEGRVEGVTVELYDSGNNFVDSNVTAAGAYLFVNLAPGQYYVRIPTPPADAPISSTPTETNPDDDVDQNDNGIQAGGPGTAVVSNLITLVANNEPNTETAPGGQFDDADELNGNMSIDFGFVQLVTIGDYIWLEDDGDGDAGTGAVTDASGVSVTVTDSDGTIYTDVTDGNGNYSIEVPANRTYTVTVSTPAGYMPSTIVPSAGNNENHDASGTVVAVGTSDDLTIDFGFTPVPPNMVTIGDLVWIEDDNDGDATTGITSTVSSATVTAEASDGTIYTDVTDGNGNYSIAVPENDTYTVTVATPSGTTPAGTPISSDNSPSTNNNLSHDGSGTLVTVGAVDNLTIDFGFYQAPRVAIEKIRNTPDPVLPGSAVTFTIRITNTGILTITTLPLTDTYSTTYLTYVGLRTMPESDSNANSGQILWSDLTQAAPNGFGQDFAPGDMWDVTVEFVATLDTTSLPNSWTVNTAQVFTEIATDTVRIFAPTSVLLSSRDVAMTDDGVTLSWSTADETELIGFHVMTIGEESGDYIQLTSDAEMIVAQHSGRTNGADYAYTLMSDDEAMDEAVDADRHYILAMVMADGTQMFMDMGLPSQMEWTIYLPVLWK